MLLDSSPDAGKEHVTPALPAAVRFTVPAAWLLATANNRVALPDAEHAVAGLERAVMVTAGVADTPTTVTAVLLSAQLPVPVVAARLTLKPAGGQAVAPTARWQVTVTRDPEATAHIGQAARSMLVGWWVEMAAAAVSARQIFLVRVLIQHEHQQRLLAPTLQAGRAPFLLHHTPNLRLTIDGAGH